MAMNFRHRRPEEPEINLIPFIDVLLVVLIFLMLSTTFARQTELKINLPTASAKPVSQRTAELPVMISADGRFVVAGQPVEGRSVDVLAAALRRAADGLGSQAPVIVISADATSPHQSVVNVMDAARRTGLTQLTFATRSPGDGGSAGEQP